MGDVPFSRASCPRSVIFLVTADESQDGFAVIDDSDSMLFAEDGWVGSRVPGRIDGYLFAYGFDYRASLKAFFSLSGHSPIIPRWAFGNWWSRFRMLSCLGWLVSIG